MNTTKEVLVRAQKLILDPKSWTAEAAARDEFGVECNATDSIATCFCAIGAIDRAANDVKAENESSFSLFTAANDALEKSAESCHSSSAIYVNDHFGHTAVMKMFDDAIASY